MKNDVCLSWLKTLIIEEMKQGIAIFNGYITLPGLRYVFTRMREEFANMDVGLEAHSNAEILTDVGSNGKISGQKDYDFILYLDKDKYLAQELELIGYRLFNKARSIELCDDKMLTHLTLANHGIKMPRTVSGPLNYSSRTSEEYNRKIFDHLSLPFVAKTNFGSMGKGVTMIKTKAEFMAYEEKNKYLPRFYQEFIPSSFGFDYRLIVINKKVVASMKRENHDGDFRSNIALGGDGVKVDLPSSYIEMAEKAATILELDYCGVDILSGEKEEPILCEVNSNAFLEGIEKVTGVNIAKTYASHIYKEIYG